MRRKRPANRKEASAGPLILAQNVAMLIHHGFDLK
jgi:hypothetical protein